MNFPFGINIVQFSCSFLISCARLTEFQIDISPLAYSVNTAFVVIDSVIEVNTVAVNGERFIINDFDVDCP